MACSPQCYYDVKCATFYASCLVSLMTLTFCFAKLFTIPPEEDKSVYIGIITTIIGVFLPQPKLPVRTNNSLD